MTQDSDCGANPIPHVLRTWLDSAHFRIRPIMRGIGVTTLPTPRPFTLKWNRARKREADPVESLGVSVLVRIRGGTKTNMLAPVLGHGSFDDGYPAPFQGLLATGTLTAAALQRHWAELQQEVGAEGRGAGAGALAGPLGMNVETAGVGVAKAQKAITRQREQKRLESLDARIRALLPAAMRRAAWLNADRNSTVWVTAWPTRDGYLSNPEFAEATCQRGTAT